MRQLVPQKARRFSGTARAGGAVPAGSGRPAASMLSVSQRSPIWCPIRSPTGIPNWHLAGNQSRRHPFGTCRPPPYSRRMNNTKAYAPPGALVDDRPPTPVESRTALLKRAKRGFVPVRKEFVQKRRGAAGEPRGSMLAEFVTNKQGRALDALLLVHGLYPVTRDEPLDTRTWARVLSAGTRCTPNAASKAFSVLEEMRLIRREVIGRQTFIAPLSETGDGSEWTRAGEDKDEDGPGFFTIPHRYWTDGLAEKLTMPGKAMFLVLLHDTNSPKTMTFTVPLDRMSEWYGISERTAERGYRELRAAEVLAERDQKVVDHKHPVGRRVVRHRSLCPPFDTLGRMSIQGKARTAVQKKNEKLEEVSSAQ